MDTSSVDFWEDDLAMAVALKDWAQSVELVLKGKQCYSRRAGSYSSPHPSARAYLSSVVAKSTPDSGIPARLAALTRELVDQIAADLSDPDIRRSEVMTLSAHLARLDESRAASKAFLRAREEMLRKRTRMIAYHGDVTAYIGELAIVTFTILRHTSDWYLAAFLENSLVSGAHAGWVVSVIVLTIRYSGFIEWCQSQVAEFATSFRRQVYGPSEDPAVIRHSLQVVAFHNRKLLRDIGLGFTFMLSTLLQPNVDHPDVQPNEIIRDSAV